ncbi:ECF-type riboflavin transporter substrate-binding protein [Psittacicella hinzii]|uniref:ECF transporter S component n=1 Tax=Psittacicella hinzii TaxID=2028575 RepID=A0A3A1YUU9_9GAMM|nr:ECF-type riboflavin transporter substrate-binding protein [Psittacicella hinzii]RIY39847.1 ECF transporter S component [Psittacicella hinzii]
MATTKRNPVMTVVAIGIGAALIMILMRFIALPSPIPNTKIQTAFGFLALFAGVFGPVAGAFAAFIGHALNDITQYGTAWWSWIICSGLLGYAMGYSIDFKKLQNGIFGLKQIITFNSVQVLANIALWAGVAPSLDIIIYKEPINKVYLQGLVSASANALSVAIIGTLLLVSYAKTRTKSGSLSLEKD